MTENPHEVSAITANALIAKRADVMFAIKEAEREIERLRAQVVHIDNVLRMFRPDADIEALPVRHRRPTKSPYFGHGEITQRVYDALRENDSITSVDVAVAAMRAKGLDPETDTRTRKDFVKRIARVMTDMSRHGDKIERVASGRPARWRLGGR